MVKLIDTQLLVGHTRVCICITRLVSHPCKQTDQRLELHTPVSLAQSSETRTPVTSEVSQDEYSTLMVIFLFEGNAINVLSAPLRASCSLLPSLMRPDGGRGPAYFVLLKLGRNKTDSEHCL